MTLFLSFMAYSAVVFYLGMRHERAKLTDKVCDRLFVPHRPRLLVSPHWPAVQAINHTEAGAGLSRGNDCVLNAVDAAGQSYPGQPAARPNLSDPNQDS